MKRIIAIATLTALVGYSDSATLRSQLAPVATQPPTAVIPKRTDSVQPTAVPSTLPQDRPTVAQQASPAVESPADKRLREFKEQVANYLSQARAGAKLLTLAPSLAQVRKKSEEITELYTHLPDVPDSIAQRKTVAMRLKNINGSFAVAEATVKLQIQAASLNSAELIQNARNNIGMVANDIKKFCTEIEDLSATQESPADKRLREFKEQVANYLSQARAGAKLLTLAPSLAQVRKKSEEITELYTHLPDVPDSIAQRKTVAMRLKNINGSFAVAEATVKLQIQAASLNSAELIQNARNNIGMVANDIKKFCTEIEDLSATQESP